jgi:hypothetical protein
MNTALEYDISDLPRRMEERMNEEYEITLEKFLFFFAKVQESLEDAAALGFRLKTSLFGKQIVYGVEYNDMAHELDVLMVKEVSIGLKKPVWWSLREQCVVIMGRYT